MVWCSTLNFLCLTFNRILLNLRKYLLYFEKSKKSSNEKDNSLHEMESIKNSLYYTMGKTSFENHDHEFKKQKLLVNLLLRERVNW